MKSTAAARFAVVLDHIVIEAAVERVVGNNNKSSKPRS